MCKSLWSSVGSTQSPLCRSLLSCRAKDQVIPDVLYWRLPCPKRAPWPLNFIDMIGRDTEAEIVDLPNIMRDKHLRRWWWWVLVLKRIGVWQLNISMLWSSFIVCFFSCWSRLVWTRWRKISSLTSWDFSGNLRSDNLRKESQLVRWVESFDKLQINLKKGSFKNHHLCGDFENLLQVCLFSKFEVAVTFGVVTPTGDFQEARAGPFPARRLNAAMGLGMGRVVLWWNSRDWPIRWDRFNWNRNGHKICVTTSYRYTYFQTPPCKEKWSKTQAQIPC